MHIQMQYDKPTHTLRVARSFNSLDARAWPIIVARRPLPLAVLCKHITYWSNVHPLTRNRQMANILYPAAAAAAAPKITFTLSTHAATRRALAIFTSFVCTSPGSKQL